MNRGKWIVGIKDEEELKKHILAVQAEAYAVSLGFASPSP